MEIEKLLEGKSYRRGSAVFPTTRELVEPFLNNLSGVTDEFRIKTEIPKEGTILGSVSDDTYTRVLIEAVLDHSYENRKRIIGLLYGLDIQNPVMKIYSGWENQACLNLSVFKPNQINVTHLNNPNFFDVYKNIPLYVSNTEAEMKELKEALDFLKTNIFFKESLMEILGVLATKCLTSSGLSSSYVNMVNFIESPKDRNGVRNIYHQKSGEYSALDLYEALIATPSAKSLDKSEDVLKIYKLFVD